MSATDDGIAVDNADSATLVLAAATSFKNSTTSAPTRPRGASARWRRSAGKIFDALRQAHVEDHQTLFRRVSLDLGKTAAAKWPTDQRIKDFAAGNDPDLAALVFQYGRYLLIASSRPGGQPANLQGIWNDSLNPPWDSKWTVNINTEMNYWPAEVANLSECTEPLFDMIARLCRHRRARRRRHTTARAAGCCITTPTSGAARRRSTPATTASGSPAARGCASTCGSITCSPATRIPRAARLSGDERRGALLRRLPDEDPITGRLISGPSNSPEQGGLVMGPTMDHEIIRAPVRQHGRGGAHSRSDDAICRAARQRCARKSRRNQIGQYGQLQEWMEDKDDPKNHHRHVSHLWAVYPGGEITPAQTRNSSAAARQSLIFRGDAATGWSMGWKINLWARFLDGDHAYHAEKPAQPVWTEAHGRRRHVSEPVRRPSAVPDRRQLRRHCRHRRDAAAKPDRRNRAAARLAERLADGCVKGLRARGGFEVDISWKDGKLSSAVIHSLNGNPVRLRCGEATKTVTVEKGGTIQWDGK